MGILIHKALELPRKLESLMEIEMTLTDICSQLKVDELPAYKITLAVSELVSNMIKHGVCYCETDKVAMTVRSNDVSLLVCLQDSCESVPKSVIDRMTSKVSTIVDHEGSVHSIAESGWGVSLISLTAESVDYKRIDNTNNFRLTFLLPQAMSA